MACHIYDIHGTCLLGVSLLWYTLTLKDASNASTHFCCADAFASYSIPEHCGIRKHFCLQSSRLVDFLSGMHASPASTGEHPMWQPMQRGANSREEPDSIDGPEHSLTGGMLLSQLRL